MQLNTICTECKEMFLFTDDLLYVRPTTHYSEKIRPICFRCSTTVGACHAYSLRCTEIKMTDRMIKNKEDAIQMIEADHGPYMKDQ